MEADTEAPPPTATQTLVKPVRVDEELGSNSVGTLGNTCLPTDWEVESESNVLSGTSDSDADGRLIYEDGYSDTSADPSQGGEVLHWRNCMTTVCNRCGVCLLFIRFVCS